MPCQSKQPARWLRLDEMLTISVCGRLITLWQVTWFSVSELQRAKLGLPVTTLEVTTLSFSFTMIATTVCWFLKPTISRPILIRTKGDRLVEDIRSMARNTVSYRVPM